MAAIEPPALKMFMGTGQAFRGKRDARSDGSYIATVWAHVLFFPLLPIAAYRIQRLHERISGVPFVYVKGTVGYRLLEKVPIRTFDVLRTYGLLFGFFGGLVVWAWQTKKPGPYYSPDARTYFAIADGGALEGQKYLMMPLKGSQFSEAGTGECAAKCLADSKCRHFSIDKKANFCQLFSTASRRMGNDVYGHRVK